MIKMIKMIKIKIKIKIKSRQNNTRQEGGEKELGRGGASSPMMATSFPFSILAFGAK
jgi:hypothetical protein